MNSAKRIILGISVALGTLFSATTINAATLSDLSSVDLNNPGDGLLTLDATTGLKWLDISETFERTVADGALPGFRLATLDEVEDLFSGFPATDEDKDPPNEVQSIISIFGGIFQVDINGFDGLVALGDSSGLATTYGCFAVSPTSPVDAGCGGGTSEFELNETQIQGFGNLFPGVYMVQVAPSDSPTSVPESSTWLGLSVVSAFVFLRKRITVLASST